MIILGIDPGVTGAISVFHATAWPSNFVMDVFDIPFQQDVKNFSRKKIYAEKLKSDIISKIGMFSFEKIVVYIEQAHAMPGQGVSSMFNYGRTNGIIEGLLIGLGIVNIKKVVPAKWKRSLSLLSNSHPKDAGLKKAKQLYPNADLTLKKHHNRADAILIGHYGCMMEGLI